MPAKITPEKAAAKDTVTEKKERLLELTKAFCDQYLDDEYWVVIEKLINKMARKRAVPFLSGRLEIWAAAVIHALGTVNFLFDRSNRPYASVGDICAYFGTSQSTTTQKSKRIRDMFRMSYFDPEFSTASTAADNPLRDMILIDGLMVPRDMFKKGQ